jgi:glycosyltransferase involved in cell wall biosynthesis
MKILYDHQIFIRQEFGGISRYHYDLIKALNIYGVETEVSLLLSNNLFIQNKDVSSHYKFLPKFNIRIRNRIIDNLNLLNSRSKIKKNDFDVFHPTYYYDYFLDDGLLKNKPFVITVHDMILEKFNLENNIIPQKKKLIQYADRIIAISEKTKQDILECIDIEEKKIEVIHQCIAVNNGFNRVAHRLEQYFMGNFILFVGGRGAYKNFDQFIKAFSILSKKYPEFKLICTGNPFSTSEKELLVKLRIQDKVISFYASDNELSWLYKNATLFVFPSLYEGFGFPILEAFSMDCPIAISDASCFPEIAGDAACYFDPTDSYAIYLSMDRILNDSDYRQNLLIKGRERLKLFSQEKRVHLTSNVYKSLT